MSTLGHAGRAAAGRLEPIRVLPVPPSCPPPLAEDPTGDRITPPQHRLPAGQGMLAIELDLVPDDELFGPQPTARSDLPDPVEWAAHLAQAVVEVMTGRRAAPQLIRWLTPEVYEVVARRAALVAQRTTRRESRPRQRVTVRRVRVCEPADGVAEASVVLHDGPRVRALAMRMTGQDGRWRVEVLQVC